MYRCELPADDFFRLAGSHICGEGFRSGLCAECDAVIESEGLCGHGSYPDNCGAADTVCVVEWRHAGDAEWIAEGEPFQSGWGGGRGSAREQLWSRFDELTADADGFGEDDWHDELPNVHSLEYWARGEGEPVIRFAFRHATGPTVEVRLRRGPAVD